MLAGILEGDDNIAVGLSGCGECPLIQRVLDDPAHIVPSFLGEIWLREIRSCLLVSHGCSVPGQYAVPFALQEMCPLESSDGHRPPDQAQFADVFRVNNLELVRSGVVAQRECCPTM